MIISEPQIHEDNQHNMVFLWFVSVSESQDVTLNMYKQISWESIFTQ